MRYAKAFGSWQEQTKGNRKLRVLATKVVKRWGKRSSCVGLGYPMLNIATQLLLGLDLDSLNYNLKMLKISADR